MDSGIRRRFRHGFEIDDTPAVDFGLYFYNLGTMNEIDAVSALSALAQDARLKVFRALVGAAPNGMTPGALSAALDIPSTTLSFHLKELAHAELITVERQGRNLHYRPALAHMNKLIGYLTDHCCQGQACIPAARKRRASC